MTVMLEKGGVPTIPDWPKIVKEGMSPALIAILRHVFHDAIQKDNAVFLEMYTAMLNEWDTYSPEVQRAASGESEERFFTESAAERQEYDRKEALKVIVGDDESGADSGSGLYGPDGEKVN